MNTSRFILSSLITLTLLGHIACGSPDEQHPTNHGRWDVDEFQPDMARIDRPDAETSAPDLDDEPHDLDPAPPEDMPPVIGDDQGVDLEDMGTPDEPDQPVDMDMEEDMPPARACMADEATVLQVPTTISSRLRQVVPAPIQETACGPVAFTRKDSYVLRITQEAMIDIWMEYIPGDAGIIEPLLLLEESCDAIDDEHIIGCGGRRIVRVDDRAASIRQVLLPGDYTLSVAERVDQDNPFAFGGRYVLHVNEVLAASQGTCPGAVALQPGQRQNFANDQGGGDQGSTRSCFKGENLMYHMVDVPAGQSLSIDAGHMDEELFIGIDLDNSCTRHARSLCAEDGSFSRRRRTVVNTSDQTQRYIIALDVELGEPYWVEATLHTLAPNASCEQATRIYPDTAPFEQDWNAAGPEQTMCYEGSRGRPLYYSYVVPSGHRLYPDSLTVIEACGQEPLSCQQTPHVNFTDQPQEFLFVESKNSAGSGLSSQFPYTVQIAENSSCDTPTPLIPGQPLDNQTTKRGLDTFNVCNLILAYNQATLYYSIEVPLGGPDYKITAVADDITLQDTLSLQVVRRPDVPGQCSNAVCNTFSDGYFRGRAPAEVVVSGSIGGGRDPASALIAVTMAPGEGPQDWPTFSIQADPVMP